MNPKSGIQLKVFEIIYLKEETADILLNYMIKSLKNHKLSDKIIIFFGDNCNANFGALVVFEGKEQKIFF